MDKATTEKTKLARRNFLQAGLAAGGTVVLSGEGAAAPKDAA